MYLEYGVDDLADVGRELVGEGARHVDEHHDVAVFHVRRDVRAVRRRDYICGPDTGTFSHAFLFSHNI